jgi:hypothetical protein
MSIPMLELNSKVFFFTDALRVPVSDSSNRCANCCHLQREGSLADGLEIAVIDETPPTMQVEGEKRQEMTGHGSCLNGDALRSVYLVAP